MLQLNYKLTDEDYIEFNEFHQLIHSEIGKRNLFFLRLIGPMISILAMIIFILARAEVMLIIGEAIVLFIFSVVDILLAKKIMKRGIRKTILKMKEKEGLPFAEETTLNFTEDQIIEITKGQEVKVDYKKVEDVCETEKAFYVYMSSVQAIIIPKRVLDQDKEKKLRQILSKNKKTGYFKNTNDTINYNTIKERSVLKNYISYKKSGSEENTMKENKVQFIAITAMAVALTYVFTAFVNVRLPIAANGGLIHLGNVPLFIMAILFGKKTGAIAGGVGMGLFDLLSGWTAWAPFTFIIVGIMGYVVGAMTEKHDQYGWKVAAIFAAFVIKIVGYYIAEIILYGNFIAPISSVPGNVVQIAVAAVVVLIVIEPIEIAVKKIGITQFA